MKITLSKHALEQARGRGVSLEQIKNTIKRGAKFLQGRKIVAEYMYIRAAYKIIDEEYFIITVMIKKGD